MPDFTDIVETLKRFRDERDWAQFHNSKDLAIAISVEANELLELFLWKDPNRVDIERLKEEIADVLTFSLLLAEKHGLDVRKIILDKIRANEEKYPIAKAKGNARKYTEF